ncbi:MAG: purine-nucleoside phosphorylase [Actinomycetia bacterium]|nr:purine-nucleoside phosphorylase [Actinomycetes bacterium]
MTDGVNPVFEKVERCAATVREKLNRAPVPKIALVLGSGLGPMADQMDASCAVPYAEIDDFPVSTAPGHAGRYLFGTLAETPLVMMQGRVHYYEGYPMSDVVLPVRVLARLGVQILVLTNAAGGLNPDFRPGDLMLITDQITTFVPSPLIGANINDYGVRFPDQTQVYDHALQNVLFDSAKVCGVPLRRGVYMQLTGPQFETPTEIRDYRALGADAVGMSTAVEAVAARHMELRVAGVSCITNMGAGMPGQAHLSSEEVDEMGKRVSAQFGALLSEAIGRMTDLPKA